MTSILQTFSLCSFKENIEQSLVQAVPRYEKQEEERKTLFFLEIDSGEILG